jgi:hypothetical protein
MNLNVGDKVKFLDATGGGVVRKIIDSRMVLVAVEGGFEIPTLCSELLKMESSEPGQRFFNESFDVSSEKAQDVAAPEPDENLSILSESATKSRKAEEVFLAFVPHDQKWLITGIMDIFLINNTSFDLLYNHYRKEGKDNYSGVDYGSLNAGSKLLLASVDRDHLPEWETGCLQFLFHKEQCINIPSPINAEFEIQGKKFYTEGSYRESTLFDGKGIFIRVGDLNQKISGTSEKKEAAKNSQVSEKRAVDDLIIKHKTADKEAEVDLHLAALNENAIKFEKGEILEFQKNYFERALESAIKNRFRRVTFIHGIGDGVLRESVVEILNKYEKIEVFDAPVNKYGAGAIEIRIPFNFQLP